MWYANGPHEHVGHRAQAHQLLMRANNWAARGERNLRTRRGAGVTSSVSTRRRGGRAAGGALDGDVAEGPDVRAPPVRPPLPTRRRGRPAAGGESDGDVVEGPHVPAPSPDVAEEPFSPPQSDSENELPGYGAPESRRKELAAAVEEAVEDAASAAGLPVPRARKRRGSGTPKRARAGEADGKPRKLTKRIQALIDEVGGGEFQGILATRLDPICKAMGIADPREQAMALLKLDAFKNIFKLLKRSYSTDAAVAKLNRNMRTWRKKHLSTLGDESALVLTGREEDRKTLITVLESYLDTKDTTPAGFRFFQTHLQSESFHDTLEGYIRNAARTLGVTVPTDGGKLDDVVASALAVKGAPRSVHANAVLNAFHQLVKPAAARKPRAPAGGARTKVKPEELARSALQRKFALSASPDQETLKEQLAAYLTLGAEPEASSAPKEYSVSVMRNFITVLGMDTVAEAVDHAVAQFCNVAGNKATKRCKDHVNITDTQRSMGLTLLKALAISASRSPREHRFDRMLYWLARGVGEEPRTVRTLAELQKLLPDLPGNTNALTEDLTGLPDDIRLIIAAVPEATDVETYEELRDETYAGALRAYTTRLLGGFAAADDAAKAMLETLRDRLQNDVYADTAVTQGVTDVVDGAPPPTLEKAHVVLGAIKDATSRRKAAKTLHSKFNFAVQELLPKPARAARPAGEPRVSGKPGLKDVRRPALTRAGVQPLFISVLDTNGFDDKYVVIVLNAILSSLVSDSAAEEKPTVQMLETFESILPAAKICTAYENFLNKHGNMHDVSENSKAVVDHIRSFKKACPEKPPAKPRGKAATARAAPAGGALTKESTWKKFVALLAHEGNDDYVSVLEENVAKDELKIAMKALLQALVQRGSDVPTASVQTLREFVETDAARQDAFKLAVEEVSETFPDVVRFLQEKKLQTLYDTNVSGGGEAFHPSLMDALL